MENDKPQEIELLEEDKHDITDSLAKKVMVWNLPAIILLVMINIACIKFLNSSMLAIISNLIGMVMQKLFEERSVVTNFFFGSSKSSKDKDKILNNNQDGRINK